MSRLERLFVGLYGGSWLAVLVVCAACLAQGRALPLLLSAGGQGVWLYLASWALLAALLARLPSAATAWRWVLWASLAGLLLNALIGAVRHPPTALAMAFALVLLGLALVPVLHAFGRLSFRRRPQRRRRHAAVSAAERRHDLTLAWLAWSLALCASFWVAYKGDASLRGVAQAMLLVVLFLALPAVVLGAWRRRAAAGLLTIAALLCVPLYRPDFALASTPLLLLLAACGYAVPRRCDPDIVVPT